LAGFAVNGQKQHSATRPADSLQRKLDFIQQNGAQKNPASTPTVMTEEEVNDYFAAGRVKLPQGVKKVSFSGDSGSITALTTVDFDQIRAVQHSMNPLMALFSGVHDVRVEAAAAGAGGKGTVHIHN